MSDEIRRIRAYIASLQCCDNGIPVTIDEALRAIGCGRLPDTAFHAGCWLSMETRTTQPGQPEAMTVIEQVLREYLGGSLAAPLVRKYPHAAEFIRRTYEWLGPAKDLGEVQRLMLRRILLPFDFLTKRTEDRRTVHEECFGPEGKGAELDARIAAEAGLPNVYPEYTREFRETLAGIQDRSKKSLYRIMGALRHGLHGLSDCHHATFRWIESWIHAVGRLSLEIPGRNHGAEADRLGRLLFGYALGLDRWLQGAPQQFLLLDLGHADLSFDPKNEILRVYAYLGGRMDNSWRMPCRTDGACGSGWIYGSGTPRADKTFP